MPIEVRCAGRANSEAKHARHIAQCPDRRVEAAPHCYDGTHHALHMARVHITCAIREDVLCAKPLFAIVIAWLEQVYEPTRTHGLAMSLSAVDDDAAGLEVN